MRFSSANFYFLSIDKKLKYCIIYANKKKQPKEKNSDLSYLTEVNSHERREEKRRQYHAFN